MFYACAAKFDVKGILEKFLVFGVNRTKPYFRKTSNLKL